MLVNRTWGQATAEELVVTDASDTITISIPEGMCADLDRASRDRGIAPDELALDVLSEFLHTQRQERWSKIFAYGERRARELGIKREDVERLIDEYREEVNTAEK